jgi:hypothetical protein
MRHAGISPFSPGEGGVLRVFNFGSLPHRYQISELGIDVVIQPGGAVTVPIDAEPGEYACIIDVGIASDPTTVGEIRFYAPGTELQPRG